MKKHIAKKAVAGSMVAALALVGCLCLAGCGGSDGSSSGSGDSGEAAQEQEEQEPAVDSDYQVSIDGARLTEDYEGNQAIVITYTWTNNSDENTSFGVACNETVFQNGVELEVTVAADDSIDSGKYLAEVQPGATTTVDMVYALEDESEVEVEVTELVSLVDTVLASATFDPASL